MACDERHAILRHIPIFTICLAFFLAFCLSVRPALASDSLNKKVLIIYPEAGWAAPANRMMYAGMRKYFDTHSQQDITLYAEAADLSLFQGADGEKRLAEFYRYKYTNEHIDAVVPVHGSTLHFLIRNRADLFSRVPLVYMAPVNIEPAPGKREYLTGATLALDMKGTIDLACKIHPGTEHVAVIAGTVSTDRYQAELARQTLQRYAGRLDLIDLAGLPMEDILHRVGQLPSHTVILYLPLFRDGAGKRYVPAEAVEMISRKANSPVYCIYDSHLGHGCVGGNMVGYEPLGEKAAELVMRVFAGETPGKIPQAVIGNAKPMFDWRQMKRWHIAESALPAGSTVQYRELSAWDRYKWVIIGFILFCILETTLIAYLLVSIRMRRQGEKSLRDSELRYRTVANFTYDWEYWIGPDGRLLYNSPSCEKVTGYGPEEFLADMDLRSRIVVPEYRGIWEEHRHGKPQGDELRLIQFQIIRKDGERCWIDHACVPVWDDRGRFLGYRASNRDVTERKAAEEGLAQYHEHLEELVGQRTAELEKEIAERRKKDAELDLYRKDLERLVKERTADLENEITRRKRAQEALAESEASLKRAQEVAILGGWTLDIRNNMLSWTDGVYEIFGLPAGSNIDYNRFLEAIHPDDVEYVRKKWEAALHGDPYDIEHRILVNGTVKWVREKAEVEFAADRTPIRGTGIVQDITMRKKVEEEHYRLQDTLAHVSRVMTVGELTTALAHEINQPLAAILANAQAASHMIDSDNPDMQELREAIEDIINDDKRAREVIQKVRALLRRDTASFEQMDINEAAQQSVRLVEKLSVIRGIPVRMELCNGAPHVKGDRIQIEQVIINLLMNAMEAMDGDAGTPRMITVSSGRDEAGNAVVSVRDTGRGIDENTRSIIFEPFFTTKTHGLGLGLSISRSIIESHGGKLNVSANSDRGALFSFSIPAADKR